jgi:hypothetical protein
MFRNVTKTLQVTTQHLDSAVFRKWRSNLWGAGQITTDDFVCEPHEQQ